MATQRLSHAIPIALQPVRLLKFSRASLLPGVSLQQAESPLGRKAHERARSLPESPGFHATSLIVIDEREYLHGLDQRLSAEGLGRDADAPMPVDFAGLTRHVLVSLTLRGRIAWDVGGHHTFDFSDDDFPYRSAGYSHTPTQGLSGHFRHWAPDDWHREVRPADLRRTCLKLDRYYRSGTWWFDRLSVALGYLWSALTTSHAELAYVSLCMALEAIASNSRTEITHILAERCAVLAANGDADRLRIYKEVKELYGLRSTIVHGRSAPKKGLMTSETLAITAKQSTVPRSALFRMLAITLDVINAVLAHSELMDILRVKRSEEQASEAISDYFQSLLLCREA